MRKTMTALAFAGVCGLAVCAAGPAHADVIYDFTTTSFSYVGPNPTPEQTGLPLDMTFDLTNAQVQSGSFALQGVGNGSGSPITPPFLVYGGDSNGFVSVSVQGATALPNALYGSLNVSLTFDAQGSITSSSIKAYSSNGSDDVVVSGPGSDITGFVGSDDPRCNADATQQRCAVSGYFTESGFSPAPVPEPASLAILGAGVFGLAAARRRRISPPA